MYASIPRRLHRVRFSSQHGVTPRQYEAPERHRVRSLSESSIDVFVAGDIQAPFTPYAHATCSSATEAPLGRSMCRRDTEVPDIAASLFGVCECPL
jgi:hypothetical protein